MLGVITEKTDEGVKIQDITKESGAEKAGLKEGDIITKWMIKKLTTRMNFQKLYVIINPAIKFPSLT